jgi:hypothetical protein
VCPSRILGLGCRTRSDDSRHALALAAGDKCPRARIVFANCPTAGTRAARLQPGRRAFSRRKIHSVTVICDGLLVESEDGVGECDQGDACQALELQDDYPAYRAAHGRVIARAQAENREEYGGEG